MKDLYEKNKLFFIILAVLAIGFLFWYFSNIVIFLLIAAIISLIGQPVVKLFDRIRIGKMKFPHALSAILTLLILLVVFLGFFSFFIPLIIREAKMISSINLVSLSGYYQQELIWLNQQLRDLGILSGEQRFLDMVQENLIKVVDFNLISGFLGKIFGYTGQFFFEIFSILFISFFFLYQPDLPRRILMAVVPERYLTQTGNILDKSKTLLTRYFVGLVIQVIVMIILYSISLSIAGVDGALAIAFFAGIINIVPYIGPLIGAIVAVILAMTSTISLGSYDLIGQTAVYTAIACLAVQLFDNLINQPLIFGKSVKAHPLEIFLVIIAASSIAGIVGMIIAVPCYTFLRIVAKEFLSQFRLVRSLTGTI